MKRFFIEGLLILADAVLAVNDAASLTWVDGGGQSCDTACSRHGLNPVVSGTYRNGQPFFVCAANEAGEGLRGGFNARPVWADSCLVAWGDRAIFSRPYVCLCTETAAHPPGTPAPSSLQRKQLTGTWTWFSGTTVTYYENGTFSAATGQKGTWQIVDPQKRTVKMVWAKDPKKGGPWYDDLTLSEDGRSLKGYNQNRNPVTGTKK